MAQLIGYYSILVFFAIATSAFSQTPCSIGCLVCSKVQKYCTACDVGYELTSNRVCISSKGSQNCSLFGSNSSICLKCKPTYKLANNTCIKDYSGCVQYSDNQCMNCGFGTSLNNGSCYGVLNCQKYNKSCGVCKQGYIYNSNICFYIKRDCAKVDVKSGACSVCATGFTLVGFGCQKTSSKTSFCDLWQGQKCLYCKSGWGLLSDNCVLIPQCQPDQYLSEVYKCQQLPVGCSAANSTGCLKCYPNFNLINASCIQALPQNCQQLTLKGICKVCRQRYYSSQYQCKKVSVFCGKYDSYGRCLNCKQPYFKFYMGSCSDPNCINSSLDGCTSCRTNFMVENSTGRCIINDPFCVEHSDLVCSRCVSGYYPSKDVCVALPESCINADRDGNCLQCLNNYYLQLDKCYQINKNINNCLTYYQYSSIPKCMECQLGYFVVLGKCVLLPAYCSIVLSNGNCVTCINDARMSNGECISNSALNCAINQGNRCLRCSQGYVLGINGICYSSRDTCIRREQSGICSECAAGFLPSRGTCLAATLIDVNCKIYSNAVCTQCYPGYYKSNNVCNTPNSNCQAFDPTTGGCTSCFPGYILTNLQCIVPPKIDNCLNYTSKGSCIICQSFYYVSANKCAKVSQLCSTYNAITGACTACYPGFTLISPSCLLMTVAYTLDPNTNQTTTINLCEKYSSSSGYCEVCKQGYYLADKKCINYASLPSADLNCKIYKPDGGCDTCFQGYRLQSKVCVAVSQQQYDPCVVKNNSLCLQCQSGYSLSQGSCILNTNQASNNLPYCQVALNSTQCQLCTNGFYPQNGVCVQVSSYCETYNPSNGQCLSCKDLYVFSEGNCVFPAMGVDTNCILYEGVYCKTCKGGYYLKDYVCKLIDGRCVNFNFDVNQCLECSSGVALFDVCQ